MDLSTLSDADLMALKGGDLSKVSDAGLMALKGESAPSEQPVSMVQHAKNIGAGLLRGAGSIGATLVDGARSLGDSVTSAVPQNMRPDITSGNATLPRGNEMRSGMDSALANPSLPVLGGADVDSLGFKGGKLTSEVLGTAGVGGALGKAAAQAGAPALAAALRSGGMASGGVSGLPGLALRAGAGAAVGGASAGLVNPEEAGTGAVIGGALPVAALGAAKTGQALGRALTGGPMADEVRQLAERAKALGIDVPVDRLVNSKPLNAVASSLNYVPLSGRASTERTMQDQLNTALSRTFGQDSPNVTMALRKASGDLGAEFDKVLKSNTVKIDAQFLDDLAESANRASNELGKDGASIIGKQVDDIVAKAGTGEIDGQAAYNIKKTLDRISQRNSPEAFYARDLKQSLMDALNRSLGPDQAKAFAAVRQQYGNMLKLEKLAQNGAEGDISIARLANLKNINSPQLQELADISAQFLKPREGQHGAMQRVMAALLAGGSAGGAGLAAGTTAAAGTAGLAAALMGVGRATNSVMNSDVARRAVLGTGTSGDALAAALTKALPLSYQAGQLNAP